MPEDSKGTVGFVHKTIVNFKVVDDKLRGQQVTLLGFGKICGDALL